MSAIDRVLRCRLVLAPVAAFAVLAGGLTAIAPADKAVAAPAIAAAKATAPDTAPDPVTAQINARVSGHRVEVLSERTGTTQVFVNPDGSVQHEIAAAPIRVRDKDAKDGWRDVDLDLSAASDGSLKPGVPLVPVAISGGEAKDAGAPLATLDPSGAGALSVDWAGKLPTPTVDGNVATYADVAPDTDLVVTATRFGFEQDFVIKKRPEDPSAVELPLTIAGDGLKVVDKDAAADSGLAIENSKGAVVGSVGAAVTTDAQTSAAPPTVTTSDLELTDSGATLTIKPKADFLADPDTTYPVTIDPSFSITDKSQLSDTYVRNDYQDTNYSGQKSLYVGTNNGGTSNFRSYMRFFVPDISGTKVTSASLNLYETGSYSCTASELDLYPASALDLTTATWKNQPAATIAVKSAVTAAKGYSSSCAAGWVNIDAAAQAQNQVDQSLTAWYFALRPASTTDSQGWKRFDSANGTNPATLTVNYDHYPTTPTNVVPTTGVTVGADRYSRWTNPNFMTQFTDPEGQTANVVFQVWDGYKTATSNLVSTCTSSATSPGTAAKCTIPDALNDNATYYVRAQAQSTYSGMNSPWSLLDQAPFKTAQSTPSVPTISCPNGNGSWATTAPSADVSCTVTAPNSGGNSAPMKLTTQVDNQPVSTKTFAVGDGPNNAVTITIPKTDGPHTISARTYAAPGQTQADPPTYTFGYGAAGISTPASGTTTTGALTVAATAPPRGSSTVTAAINWRLAGTSTWTALAASSTTGVTAGDGSQPVTYRSSGLDTTSFGPVTRRPTLLELQVCFTYSGASAQCTAARSVLRVPHAFGDGFPTAASGEGTVALWTGELALDATDVNVNTPMGSLSVSRTHASFADPQNSVTGAFGPGWSASFGDDGDATALQVVDSTGTDGTISFTSGDDDPLVFREPGSASVKTPTGTYAAVNDATKTSGYVLTSSGSGTAQKLVLTNLDGSVSTWGVINASASSLTWSPLSHAEAAAHTTESYTTDSSGRIVRILAPVANGVTCGFDTASLGAGCSALTINYSASSTAAPTGSATGAFANQVSSIDYKSWDPDSSAMKTTTVATYAYNSLGRLATATDARMGLSTKYEYAAYGSNVVLTKVTHDGYAPYTYNWDNTGSHLVLKNVQRDPAVSGGTTATLASFVYDIPTSTTGLPDLSAATVAKWGQTRVPAIAYAVFGMDHPVANTSAANLAAADWPYASLSFTDTNGFTVNKSQFGAGKWISSAQFYSPENRPSSTLDGSDTAAALAGVAPDINAGKTFTRYNADVRNGAGAVTVGAGTYVLDTWGPVIVASDSGRPKTVRIHTHYDYDQGAPNSGINPATGLPYVLVTTATVGVADPGNATENPSDTLIADLQTISVTRTGYDSIGGGAPGWAIGESTSTTTVMPNSSDNITRQTVYDADDNVIEARDPGSAGADAGTTKTLYYAADASTSDSDCNNKPQWAGLICWTGPAVAPTSGNDIPDKKVNAYNRWLEPLNVLETSGSGAGLSSRTTTYSYLADGRLDRTAVSTTGINGSAPVPATRAQYDSSTKVSIGVSNLSGTSDTVTTSVTSGFDNWGRVVRYTDSSNNLTSTSYVDPGLPGAGQVNAVTTAKGTSTYSYDGTDAAGQVERRGLATGLSVSGLGTFAASYDLDGILATETEPGGVTQKRSVDTNGRLVGLTYSGQNGVWLGYTRAYNAAGQVDTDTDTTGRSITYTYDRAGRLAAAADTVATAAAGTSACTTRTYAFDVRGNRTSRASASGAACTTSSATSMTWAYDVSSRQLSGANGTGTYVYDTFGRQTSIPGSDAANGSAADTSVTYFDNDLARSVAQPSGTTTFTLDPLGRRAGSSNGSSTTSSAYIDDSGVAEWVTKTTGSSTTTSRYVADLTGGFAANIDTNGSTNSSTLQLTNLAGAVVAAVSLPSSGSASGVSSYAQFDEYGRPLAGSVSTGVLRYGWQGAALRETSDSGLVLMGVRLYNASTGRFTSPDPVAGGNENAYNYPNDPVNGADLTGAYSYTYTFLVANTEEVGSSAFVFKIFRYYPDRVFPFDVTGCSKFVTGARCVLHVYPGPGGTGTVQVAVSADTVKFTVLSTDYFDRRGSTVSFRVFSHGPRVYLRQHGVGNCQGGPVCLGVDVGFAKREWLQQTGNLRDTADAVRWYGLRKRF